MYNNGGGLQADKKKAQYHFEKAAMGGHVRARHHLGVLEGRERNDYFRAMKHFLISASAGYNESLEFVQSGYYTYSLVTKADFQETLRAHKNSQDELKSEWRDRAVAAKRKASVNRK